LRSLQMIKHSGNLIVEVLILMILNSN